MSPVRAASNPTGPPVMRATSALYVVPGIVFGSTCPPARQMATTSWIACG